MQFLKEKGFKVDLNIYCCNGNKYILSELLVEYAKSLQLPIIDGVDMNKNEQTCFPQLHLSAKDGDDVDSATQIVFHKMANETVFIEWHTRKELNKLLLHDQANFDSDALNKLKEFLNNPKTY